LSGGLLSVPHGTVGFYLRKDTIFEALPPLKHNTSQSSYEGLFIRVPQQKALHLHVYIVNRSYNIDHLQNICNCIIKKIKQLIPKLTSKQDIIFRVTLILTC